jgi:hypothetical protein
MALVRSPVFLVPFVLLLSFSLFWFSDTIADPDLWGHIRFGQAITRAGSVVQADIYSYRTSGQRWINHEWLAEVIFARLYNLSGSVYLVGFKLLLSMLVIGLSYIHLVRRGLGPYRSVLLLVLICIPYRMGLGTIRPQIFTYLLFFVELLLLDRAETGRERWLWVLPFVMTVWVNLHGGVLAGVGVLGIWIAARSIVLGDEPGRAGRRLGLMLHLGLIGVACTGALLVNPYRADLVLFLLRTATVPRPEIREWVPVALMSLPGLLFLGLLMIGIAGLVASRRRRKPETIVIFAVAAVLPLISNRHYPLFALTLVVLGGEHLADVWNRLWPPKWSRAGRSHWTWAGSILVSLVLLGLSFSRLGCIRVESFYFNFPARAIALLKQSGVHANMAVPFDWGEYVIWHLGPNVKVSMDGRRETVYSDPGLSYRMQERGLLREGPVAFVGGKSPWYDELLVLVPKDRK